MAKERITQADIITFTRGDCHIMARKLHEITGWPIRALIGHDWCAHYFVVAPTGHPVDIEGVHTISDMEERWECSGLEEMNEEEMQRWLGWGEKAEGWATPRAEQLAPHIIAEAERVLDLTGAAAVPSA